MLSVPPAMILDPRFREIAPTAFAIPGENFYEIGGPDDFLRWALPLYKAGADAVYCSGSLATVRLLAEHAIPVCGHVGLIPSKSTWTGGFRAVGKTLETAKLVWSQVRALEQAGAFAAEIEVVPHSIGQVIAERTSLFLISMGAGPGYGAQYLFSCDVLGENTGHIPRHAKVYRDFASEYTKLQTEREAAYSEFVADVTDRSYPAPQHTVDAEQEMVEEFRAWLHGEA